MSNLDSLSKGKRPLTFKIKNCCPLFTFRISPGEGGSPKSPAKEGMPTITEQDEENDTGIPAREDAVTPDKEKTEEQNIEKPKGEAGSIPVVEPLLGGQQDLPLDEEGKYMLVHVSHLEGVVVVHLISLWFYCTFHKHANSEVQKPTDDCVFRCRQSS